MPFLEVSHWTVIPQTTWRTCGCSSCCSSICNLWTNIKKTFYIECEESAKKMRTCICIKNGICYERRRNLEGINNNLVIIDFTANKKYRLINVYRVFSTNDGSSPHVKFNWKSFLNSDFNFYVFLIIILNQISYI